MLVLMIIGWLVTVGCFLLYVRHLQAGQTNAMKDKESDNSPIANSEQQIEPKRVFQYKPSTVFPVSKQETQNKQEPCQPAVKIPKVWKKADGKTRHVKKGEFEAMFSDGSIGKTHGELWNNAWTNGVIIAYRECKPSEKRHIISDKKVSASAKKSSKNKGFSAKAKKQGSVRKTVTVKKRVTK